MAKRHYIGKLTRKEFNGDGISFVSTENQGEIKLKKVEMKTGLGMNLSPKTKIWIPPFDPYEKELVDYNRLIGGGITNMREINDTLIHMKQRGDILTISNSFACNISNIASAPFITNITTTNTNKLYDIRLFNGFYAYLIDGANKTKIIQIGAAGTGETVSSELLVNGNMESGSPPSSWIVRNRGETVTSVADERTGGIGTQSIGISCGADGGGGVYQNITTAGSLYIQSAWGKRVSGGGTPAYILYAATSNLLFTSTSWELKSQYQTATNNPAIFLLGGVSSVARFDDVSLKQVLTPDATGLVFTPISEESGWNPNTTYKLRIKYKI